MRSFFGRSFDLHIAIWLLLGSIPPKNVPKMLSSHVVVKVSLKAVFQNHNKIEKIPTLKTSISGCPHLHTVFFRCNCKYSGLTPWTTFHFYVAPQASSRNWVGMWQKIHLSNEKVLIMAEASSLTELFLHRNVTYKLLKQNCETNLCGSACATENIAFKFTLFVRISLIDWKKFYRSKQKFHCFLLKARG